MSNAFWLEAEEQIAARENAADRDNDREDLFDEADRIEERAKSEPIYRIQTDLQVGQMLDYAESAARLYAEKVGGDKSVRDSFLVGMLKGALRDQLAVAAELERELMRELQIAINCGGTMEYERDHASRVQKRFGLIFEEAA